MTTLLRVMTLWRGQAIWLALGLAVSLAATGAGIGLMGASGALIAGGTFAALLTLRLLGPLRVALRYLERLTTHDAMFRALGDLRVWLFRHLAASSAGGLGFRHAGDLLARLVQDVDALDGLYQRVVVPLAAAVLLLPVLAMVMLHIDPLLAMSVALLFAAAAFVLPALAMRGAAEAGQALAAGGAGLRIACLDALSGVREVRAFSAEGRMLATVQAREATLLAGQHEMARRSARAGAAAFLCAQGGILAVLIAAGLHPVSAVLLTFVAVASFEAIGGLPRAGAAAGHAAAAARRVLAAADEPPALADPAAPTTPPAGGALSFEAVHFAWSPGRAAVFDGLTLDLPQGVRVALLGPSGAGKSTLAALALKVAAPGSGRILLGGVDIARLPAAAVRARIGWLGQATHLFDDTIRNNLLLARPDADDAALWAALDAARVGDVVRRLPGGLDAWVGEQGAHLSGGEGRRVALARALLSPAPVLILDEPCSGLDADTEREFLTTLNEVAEGRTVVLIAHRLTGVERLDRIFRLSAGRAVAAAG